MLLHYRKLCLRLCILIQIHKWSVTQKMSLMCWRDLRFLHAFPEYYCCTLKCLLSSAVDLLNEVHVQKFAHPAGSALKWDASKRKKERKRKEKKVHIPQLNDGFYLVSVCWAWAWLCRSVMSVSMVKNTGHAKLQLVQGVKKHVQRQGGRRGGSGRETQFQELRGCGITESKTWQKSTANVYSEHTETNMFIDIHLSIFEVWLFFLNLHSNQ